MNRNTQLVRPGEGMRSDHHGYAAEPRIAPSTRAALRKAVAILTLICLVLAAYLLVARPYQLRLGASDAEVNRVMPGDELNPAPTFLSTRAITINGTPEEVWPWLVQMGYRRAGFYGYDIIENQGSERGIRSADRIEPELQHFKVGDDVPISATTVMSFYAIEPNRYLIWGGDTGGSYGTFNWALYPVDENHTRLVSRIRWSHHWTEPGPLALDLFSEFTDHLAVRKILSGVKDRVEGHLEPMAIQNIESAIYLGAALVFFAALVLVLIRPLTRRGWLLGLTAGAAWLFTWYAPVPVGIGAGLEVLVLWGLVTRLVVPAEKPVGVGAQAVIGE
ncbi:MAG TPA: hypothetical protein VHS28_04640 [Chloroflexota bacterium]|nr:hypothetical protein [Chloroflexota bacterium]